MGAPAKRRMGEAGNSLLPNSICTIRKGHKDRRSFTEGNEGGFGLDLA
jgi:hypothetical protein